MSISESRSLGPKLYINAASVSGSTSINSVPADGSNNIALAGGTGINVTNDPGSSLVTLDATGVVTVNGLTPDPAGEFTVQAGAGITVTPIANGITVTPIANGIDIGSNAGTTAISTGTTNFNYCRDSNHALCGSGIVDFYTLTVGPRIYCFVQGRASSIWTGVPFLANEQVVHAPTPGVGSGTTVLPGLPTPVTFGAGRATIPFTIDSTSRHGQLELVSSVGFAPSIVPQLGTTFGSVSSGSQVGAYHFSYRVA